MTITNTTIADLVPSEKVLGQTVKVLMDETNTLINSGIVARGPEVNAVANGGPRKASIPFLNPLATDEYNIGMVLSRSICPQCLATKFGLPTISLVRFSINGQRDH